MLFDRHGLAAAGFDGFHTIEELRHERARQIPPGGGVYVVLREEPGVPEFLETSTGGWFKGQDPSVSKATLRAKWDIRTPVVYIGKGDGAKGLRGRLLQYLNFGAGKNVGHWGGRLTWQIEDADRFMLAWRLVEEGQRARDVEVLLLEEFEETYGHLPFANLSH